MQPRGDRGRALQAEMMIYEASERPERMGNEKGWQVRGHRIRLSIVPHASSAGQQQVCCRAHRLPRNQTGFLTTAWIPALKSSKGSGNLLRMEFGASPNLLNQRASSPSPDPPVCPGWERMHSVEKTVVLIRAPLRKVSFYMLQI